MKWSIVPAIALLAAMPASLPAQEVLPVGHIPRVDDPSPTVWAISGYEMVPVKRTVAGQTPITRTLLWDARTVEILSRTQAPPLRASDIKHVRKNGKDMVVVRRYVLMEVTPEDARAEGTSTSALAKKWADSVRRALPLVAPMPSRFGI